MAAAKNAPRVRKQQRFFAMGESLRVAKKSHLLDKTRKQEGFKRGPKTDAPPGIDCDVTGAEGKVCGDSYLNPKRNEYLVPIRLPNDAVIAVPEDRLERTEAPPTPKAQRAEENAATEQGPGAGGVSPSTIEFWRKYFSNEEKAKEHDRKKKGR